MAELRSLLQDFYREKLGELLRHQAGARLMRQYDINNAYQYIINRDEVHLSWIRTALEQLGAAVEDQMEPDRTAEGSTDRTRAILEEDVQSARTFIGHWRPRVEAIGNARHRGMLRVILGEVAEQQRSFEQARAGQLDLLGRRTPDVGRRVGEVLSTRWVE